MKKYTIYWAAPVYINNPQGGSILVEGPHHAIDLLEGDWPEKSGRHYRSALRGCDLACRLLGGLESSRELFVAAALAAHVLAPHPVPGGYPGGKRATSPLPVSDTSYPGALQAYASGSPHQDASHVRGSHSL